MIARNSPILFVQILNFSWKISSHVCKSIHLYSISPGFPEHAASTAILSAKNGISLFLISIFLVAFLTS
jgi:hypothetical protein